MFIAMRKVWCWSLPLSLAVAGLFIVVDGSFVAANMVKFFEGGWIPLLVASILFFLMTCWSQGYTALRGALESGTISVADFLTKYRDQSRVKGTAVYLAGRNDVVPVSLLQNLKHNKILHERIVLLHVATEHIPRVDPAQRVKDASLAKDFHAMSVLYGFMEQPNIPRALLLESLACPFNFNMAETSFFIGRPMIVAISPSKWSRMKIHIFKFMYRNALPATEFFQIPAGRVVELGGQVEI
jgi:KUP system potassium uptake protein